MAHMTRYQVVLLGDDRYPLHRRGAVRVVIAQSPEHAAQVAFNVPPEGASYAIVTEIVSGPVTVGVKKSAKWAGVVGGVMERVERPHRRGDLEAKTRGEA